MVERNNSRDISMAAVGTFQRQ